MNRYDKSEEISKYIRYTSDIIHEEGHKIACEHGLTFDQYHLLLYIKHCPTPPSIREISEKFNRAQNTISEKITRLEDKDLVRREQDTKDRRIIRVIILDEGIRLIHDIRKERTERVAFKAIDDMDEESVNQLLSGLIKFYENILKEE